MDKLRRSVHRDDGRWCWRSTQEIAEDAEKAVKADTAWTENKKVRCWCLVVTQKLKSLKKLQERRASKGKK